MAMTELYELESLAYGTTGWTGIVHSNFQKIENNLFTAGMLECGEDVSAYQAVYLKSDGKIWLAQADGTKQPAIGIMIEDGLATEEKRFQTYGTVTNSAWDWTGNIGQPVYLDPTTAGALTVTPSGANAQIMGYCSGVTSIFMTSLWMSAIVGAQPYVMAFNRDGTLSDGQIFVTHRFSMDVEFPVNLSGSFLNAHTAATSECILSIKKNGVEVGTATFAASGTSATLVMASAETFSDGDTMTIVAPATADTTLADFYGTFEGVR